MSKHKLITGAVVASSCLFVQPALASDGPAFIFGGLVTNDLIRSGESLTDGKPGLAVEAEIEKLGFFAGVEVRTLRDSDYLLEAELAAGYRLDMEPLAIEFGVARAWAQRAGAGDIELFSGLEFTFEDRFTIGAEVVYAPEPNEWMDIALTASFALNEQLDISGTVGHVPVDNLTYGALGLTYSFTENVAVDLRYHYSREIGSRVAGSLVFAFGSK